MKAFAVLLCLLSPMVLAKDPIIGLLEIPKLHSGINQTTASADEAPSPANLYSEPRNDSNIVVIVRNHRELVSREHDYEQVSAVVLERRDGWSLLRYEAESESIYGWLNPVDAGRYRSTIELLSNRGLQYLTEAWDGKLYESPALDANVKPLTDIQNQQEVRLISFWQPRGAAGEVWLQLALVRGSCTVEPLEIVDTGWVPMYSESGANSVWYYSRGC